MAESQLHSGTGAGLIAFLAYAADKGLMKPATAGPYRRSAQKILAIDEGWEASDLKKADLDALFDRFVRLHGHQYTPASLTTYKTRITRSVEMYLEWLEDPSSFRMGMRNRAPKAPSKSQRSSSGAAKPGPRSSTGGDELVAYPFPLRAGVFARLELPPDMTPGEAERLSAFIESLAFNEGSADE